MLWLFVVTACWEPAVTGPSGMVGVVSDSHGVPIAGLRVESVEQGELTDAGGQFSVSYKDPSRYVMLKQGNTWYRRSYLPQDDGQIVALDLPAQGEAQLRCEVPSKCALALKWKLPDGLSASINEMCEPGAGMALTGIPAGAEPSVSCIATRGGGERPVELAVSGALWRVVPQATPVRVAVAFDGDAPSDCEVTVGGQAAQPSGEGYWVGRARGGESVVAWCDGVPTVPVAVSRPPEDGVELTWTGASVAMELPDAVSLHVVREGESGWAIVAHDEAGTFALPPLPAGRYQLATDATQLVGGSDPGKDVPEGVAVFEQGRGLLVLERDRSDGRIEVEIR